MSYAIDLHTHSIASPDGALRFEDYQNVLKKGMLHYIAVTDHNSIEMALRLREQFGEAIIIGEEITTTEGEIIGLYLQEEIPAQLSAEATVQAIKKQNGLVCIPHPFETVRKGIDMMTLQKIAADVDMIEVHNGRAIFQNRSSLAKIWAQEHQVPGVANSDAHGKYGWGMTASIIAKPPTRDTLVGLLRAAQLRRAYVGVRGIMYPKFNRIRKRFL